VLVRKKLHQEKLFKNDMADVAKVADRLDIATVTAQIPINLTQNTNEPVACDRLSDKKFSQEVHL
jgi:hypothetical protein